MCIRDRCKYILYTIKGDFQRKSKQLLEIDTVFTNAVKTSFLVCTLLFSQKIIYLLYMIHRMLRSVRQVVQGLERFSVRNVTWDNTTETTEDRLTRPVLLVEKRQYLNSIQSILNCIYNTFVTTKLSINISCVFNSSHRFS